MTPRPIYVLIMFTPTPPATADGPKSTGCLLGLGRKLIDYGQQLVATPRQYPPATSFSLSPRFAGTIDLGQILARIACGLQRAVAPEARFLRRSTGSSIAQPIRQPPRSSAPIRHPDGARPGIMRRAAECSPI